MQECTVVKFVQLYNKMYIRTYVYGIQWNRCYIYTLCGLCFHADVTLITSVIHAWDPTVSLRQGGPLMCQLGGLV